MRDFHLAFTGSVKGLSICGVSIVEADEEENARRALVAFAGAKGFRIRVIERRPAEADQFKGDANAD